jgi:hypothetical protein
MSDNQEVKQELRSLRIGLVVTWFTMFAYGFLAQMKLNEILDLLRSIAHAGR